VSYLKTLLTYRVPGEAEVDKSFALRKVFRGAYLMTEKKGSTSRQSQRLQRPSHRQSRRRASHNGMKRDCDQKKFTANS
jgi:hypothetical protein